MMALTEHTDQTKPEAIHPGLSLKPPAPINWSPGVHTPSCSYSSQILATRASCPYSPCTPLQSPSAIFQAFGPLFLLSP